MPAGAHEGPLGSSASVLTRRTHAAHRSLLEQFDRVVAEQPDATALIAGRERLSFRELQSWSVRIADDLGRRLGVGNQPVAIMLGQTPAAVATMLGVARTGRPFMHLDPALPDLRLEHMLELADAAAVVVEDASSAQARGCASPRHRSR